VQLSLKTADLRIAFGFFLDMLCSGDTPASENSEKLFPVAWDKASDDMRKTVGIRYHGLYLDPSTDTSSDEGAAARLLDFLTEVKGIRYIPDAVRARIYRRTAKKLGDAKDTSYGWLEEEKAARTLAQFGPWVPAIAFEEVYQEILAVYCGNHWGRSKAHVDLDPFMEKLTTPQIRQVAQMFIGNDRVQEELHQSKPAAKAVDLLEKLQLKLTISAHKDEIDEAITLVSSL
jgi:hypothetical protein